MQSNAERRLTDRADVRHLLRRLAFRATDALESAVTGLTVDEAVDTLVNGAKRAPRPVPPPFVLTEWINTALLFTDTTAVEYQQAFAEQDAAAQADIERLRHWWLQEMVATEAPLRENLVLFLHGTLGSTTGSVNMPQALHARNDRLRRGCLGTVPALLESLVTDPAMMIQIGMDDYREEDMFDEEFPNFRPGRLVLENWTVGSGGYAEEDVAELCRALTGWRVEAPSGYEPDREVDPEGFRSQRRTGLHPVFEAAQFVDRSKTSWAAERGSTPPRPSATWPVIPTPRGGTAGCSCATSGSRIRTGTLARQLSTTYRDTGGSLVALVRAIAGSEAFWSPASRWALVKSPIHLAVGACRQLQVFRPPLAALGTWLAAAGQTLFQTPASATRAGRGRTRGSILPSASPCDTSSATSSLPRPAGPGHRRVGDHGCRPRGAQRRRALSSRRSRRPARPARSGAGHRSRNPRGAEHRSPGAHGAGAGNGCRRARPGGDSTHRGDPRVPVGVRRHRKDEGRP